MLDRTAWLKTASRAALALLVTVVWLKDVQGGSGPIRPAAPREWVEIPPLPTSGKSLEVPAGGDLQAAIHRAQPGDTITLQAGARFTGNFTLPEKFGSGWIVIRTSAPDGRLPPPGSRVTPAHAALMPKIVSPNTAPAIRTADGAHGYRFIGVEITTTHATRSSTHYNVVLLGTGSETSTGQLPYDIILERCYIHGTPTGNVRRGIALNGSRIAVVDSHLSDFHEAGGDSQAILGWNGPGPFKIVNNYLEGAGENVMFGGGDPAIRDLVPSDIEIRGNHFSKPLSWKLGHPSYAGIPWTVKNLLELKNARRVLIEDNLFEHNWIHAQSGFAILFTVRNQDGAAPWSTVEDVTFSKNIVRRTASGVNVLGRDDNHPSQQTQRLLIEGNLFQEVGGAPWGEEGGTLFQILRGTRHVVIQQNTGLQAGRIIMADGEAHIGFVYRNNVTLHNQYGIIGTGTPPGVRTLAKYFPGSLVEGNVIVGGNPAHYPGKNFFPASLRQVGFLDPAAGKFLLAESSGYRRRGAGGRDPGADFQRLSAAGAALSGRGHSAQSMGEQPE